VARPGRAVAVAPDQVAAAVRPLVKRRALGPHYAVLVTDLRTGKPVYRQGSTTVIPASTTKLLTAAAALEALGPMVRLRTTVQYGRLPGAARL
jgi:D-alanyl-D-alanine carboxypeptidase/D-alanyl-D-alanine-endopeptidase (penicillin-binding protein 4)